jgi:hypothetical protein
MAINRPVALITGATSGIGEAYARRLAKDGYDLIITGRRREIINPLAEELAQKHGVKAEVVLAELSHDAELEALAQKAAQIQNLELLINNAGFGSTKKFHEEDFAVQADMLKVHCLAAMRLMHTVIPGMVKRGRGAIINLSSARAFLAGPKMATYTGTKAFLNFFSESVALELKGTGVKIQVLCPGFTRTDFHSRIGLPTSEDNRGFARWMTSEQVVDISLEQLKTDKVICLPSFWYRMITKIPHLLPTSIYYQLMLKYGDKR